MKVKQYKLNVEFVFMRVYSKLITHRITIFNYKRLAAIKKAHTIVNTFFYLQYSSTLCLVVLTTGGPEEVALFTPIKDFLYLKGFAPIEVRSPGEALIQTRQAKFFLVIASDDDHDLIKKIK